MRTCVNPETANCFHPLKNIFLPPHFIELVYFIYCVWTVSSPVFFAITVSFPEMVSIRQETRENSPTVIKSFDWSFDSDWFLRPILKPSILHEIFNSCFAKITLFINKLKYSLFFIYNLFFYPNYFFSRHFDDLFVPVKIILYFSYIEVLIMITTKKFYLVELGFYR